MEGCLRSVKGDRRCHEYLIVPFAISTTTLSIAASTARDGCAWWFTSTAKVMGRPSGRSMYPASVFTPAMLPVLARTRPSRGVRTNRVRRLPVPPDCGSPGAKVAYRDGRGYSAAVGRRRGVRSGSHWRARTHRRGRTRSSRSAPSRSGSGAPPEGLRPASRRGRSAPQLLEQHLGEQVLTGVEDRKDPVAHRPRDGLRQRPPGARTSAYSAESAVERVVPVTAIPASASACRSARAANRLGSLTAKYSVRGDRSIATVPSAQTCAVPGAGRSGRRCRFPRLPAP